jgi:hypothetical protein
MPFTKDQQDHIVKALEKRANRPCPMCEVNEWAVLDGMALIQLHDRLPFTNFGDSTLPSVVAVCKVCGFTAFFNIHVLGLSEILGFPPAGVPLPNA